MRQGVQHLAKRLADSAAAPAAEPCAWSEQLHAAAAPSAAFADQLRAVSALFDVGVTSEIKVRVPLGFSGKGYTSFPLPDPFVDGEWSQQWPDDLLRLASVAPSAAEIERLVRFRLPSAAEAAWSSGRSAIACVSAEDIQIGLFAKCCHVHAWNRERMEGLPGSVRTFESVDSPSACGFVPKLLPARLELKLGMPVMTLINRAGYVNGTIGTALAVEDDRLVVSVAGKDGARKEHRVDSTTDTALAPRPPPGQKTRDHGSRTQLPVRPAFAFTVHKVLSPAPHARP